MAITYKNKSSNLKFSTGTQSMPLPSGWAAGDFVIAMITSSSTITFTGASWTKLLDNKFSGTNYNTIVYKIMQTGDTAPTVTASDDCSMLSVSYAGVDVNTPVDSYGTSAYSGGSNPIPFNVTTTTVANAMCVCLTGVRQNTNFTAWGSYTAAVEIPTERVNNAAANSSIAIGDFIHTAVGDTYEKKVTMVSTGGYSSLMVALTPALSTFTPKFLTII